MIISSMQTSVSIVNLGTEPLEPLAENCWDDYQLDSDLCIYVNLGTEPLEPVAENCW